MECRFYVSSAIDHNVTDILSKILGNFQWEVRTLFGEFDKSFEGAHSKGVSDFYEDSDYDQTNPGKLVRMIFAWWKGMRQPWPFILID